MKKRIMYSMSFGILAASCGLSEVAAVHDEGAGQIVGPTPIVATETADYPKPMVPAVGDALPEGAAWEDTVRTQYANYFGITSAPDGPFVAGAEFAQQKNLVVSWTGQFGNVVADVVRRANPVTQVWILHDGASSKSGFQREMAAYGASVAGLRYLDIPLDSIWARDFGPISIKDSNSGRVGLVDPRYYWNRVYDDAVPTQIGQAFGLNTFRMPVNFEGGNFMTNGLGTCFVSDGVYTYNELSKSQINEYFKAYLGCIQMVWLEPLIGEGTTHIDMFAKIVDETTVILGDYSPGDDFANSELLDRNARVISNTRLPDGRRLNVVRIPMPGNYDGNFRTYVNSQFINGENIIPIYTDDRRYEAEALAGWRAAMPGWNHTVTDATELITWSGAVHCILKEIEAGTFGEFQTDPATLCDYSCHPGDTSGGRGCSNVSAQGTCSGGDAYWCEAGNVQSIGCSSSCSWSGTAGHYSCAGSTQPPPPTQPPTTPVPSGYENTTRAAIPDASQAGVESSVNVPDSGAVQSVALTVDITHTYRGDLTLLLSHQGRTVIVVDQQGGSASNIKQAFSVSGFSGMDKKGTWTLRVVDQAAQDVGTLNSWRLDFGGGAQPQAVEFASQPSVNIPDNNTNGVLDTIDISQGGTLRGLAVALDISHTYIGDLRVTLQKGGTVAVLHDNAGGDSDDLFMTVTTDVFLGTDLAGRWTLRVVDSAGQDVGTLKSWKIVATL